MDKSMEEYVDKMRIIELLTRYFRAIDERQFEPGIIEETFTLDARIVKPNGTVAAGQDEIFESNCKSFARFKATQHILTDYLIEIDGNAAAVRANLTGMHLWADDENNPRLNGKYFKAGVVLRAEIVNIEGRWRVNELNYRNVWRTGEGLAEMAQFGRER